MIINRINITVDPNTRVSKKRLVLINQFAEHVASFLNLDHVEMLFLSGSAMPGMLGMCDGKDYVEIRVIHDFREMLRTIAHELCHAFQYQSGRLLVQFNGDKTKFHKVWLGKNYSPNLGMSSPWEQEAMAFEDKMKDAIEFFVTKLK